MKRALIGGFVFVVSAILAGSGVIANNADSGNTGILLGLFGIVILIYELIKKFEPLDVIF